MDDRTPSLCRWWGHQLDPEASHYYGVDYCCRCERQVERNTGILRLRELAAVRIFIIGREIRMWIQSYQEWWKCSECGKRFGKHDDTYDHIPF